MGTLKDKALAGIFWSFLQKIGSNGISFVVAIFLARLLTPKDFGLVSMIMIFIQISQAVIRGGFKQALIQKERVDNSDYSSVFYINVAVGLLLYGLLFVAAPFIGEFYNQSLLKSLIRVLAIVFIFNAFSFVQESRLTREMRFKSLMLINIPSTIAGGIIGILMALYGLGVWSIVWMQLVARATYAIQIWLYTKWRPSFTFKKRETKQLFSFGGRLLISEIITTIYNNIYLVVIGKFYPANNVGYYQNSFNLVNTPSNVITSVIAEVTFPAFSEMQKDNARLRSGYRRAMQQVFFWICPLYVLSGALAEPLFRFLFTDKWLPAVPYFQWLCIVGIFQPLIRYNSNIIVVKGRSDLFLRLQFIWRLLTIIAIMTVFPFGIRALLIIQALSSIFSYCLFGYYSGKFIQYSVFQQLKDVFSIVFASLIVGLSLWSLNEYILSLSSFLRVVLGFSLGMGAYLLTAHLFRFSAFVDLLGIYKENFSILIGRNK